MASVEVKGFLKNSLAMLVAKGLDKVLAMVLVIYLSRRLGPEAYGKLETANVFVTLFGILILLGVDKPLVSETARDRSRAGAILTNVLALKLVAGVAAGALIYAVAILMRYPQSTARLIYMVAFSFFFNSLAGSFYAVFNGFERFEYETLTTAVAKLSKLILSLIALSLGYGAMGVGVAYLGGSLINLAVSIYFTLRRFTGLELRIDRGIIKTIFLAGLPFALDLLFVQIYFNIDSVMLSRLADEATVGWYRIAYQFVFAFDLIPTAISISAFPLFARLYPISLEEAVAIYRKIFRYLLVLSIPMAAGVTLLGGKMVALIFGSGYFNSAAILRIIIWTTPFIFLTSLQGRVLGAIGRSKEMALVTGAGALFNILFNMIAIPLYGAEGAALATVATEIASFSLYSFFIRKHLGRVGMVKALLLSLLSSLLMGFVIFYLRGFNLFINIIIGATLYLGAMVVVGGISREDLIWAVDLVKGKVRRLRPF